MELFSKRKGKPNQNISYEIPEIIRNRILLVFRDKCYEPHGGFVQLLEDVADQLVKEYGFLRRPGYDVLCSGNPILDHFIYCKTDELLDFIELCFQQSVYSGGQDGVNEINKIFNECGIGYTLTSFIEYTVEKEISSFAGKRVGKVIEYEYPKIIKLEHELIHNEILKPCLELLSDPRFRVANSEMLKAHAALKVADYENAITLACAACESLLKTIIAIKKLTYNPDKDTCSRLIKICCENGLFPAFYCPMFEAIGSVRNKLSDAHGRGTTKIHSIRKENAIHLVQMTSVHMVFLAELAGIRIK